jgi:hypothetical protein
VDEDDLATILDGITGAGDEIIRDPTAKLTRVDKVIIATSLQNLCPVTVKHRYYVMR